MKKQIRFTAIITAVTLAGSIQVLAAQDDTNTVADAKSAAEITAGQQSPTAEASAPVAGVPLEVQTLSRPVAVESVLSEMKIYPSF